jgi:hypothetical protein
METGVLAVLQSNADEEEVRYPNAKQHGFI